MPIIISYLHIIVQSLKEVIGGIICDKENNEENNNIGHRYVVRYRYMVNICMNYKEKTCKTYLIGTYVHNTYIL